MAEPTTQRLSAFRDPAQRRALEFLFGIVSESALYVAPGSPISSIAQALSLVTATRNTIFVAPGTYVEPSITWPAVANVQIVGTTGNSADVIIKGAITNAVITINPTSAAAFVASLENLTVYHDTQVGLEVNNTTMTAALRVNLNNVAFTQATSGDSIHGTHTTAGQTVSIIGRQMDTVLGLVNLVCGNNGDVYRFYDSVLIGGVTTTSTATGEIALLHSVVLTSGFSVQSGQVATNANCVYRTLAGVYSAFTDAFSV